MNGTTLLSLQNLSVWYAPDQPVLSDLSLDLREKEVVGLIGLNGAGKTTLIKTVAGLLNGFRLSGAAWHGRPFSFRDRAFKKERFIVFAEGRSFPYFTFREYLSYVAASYGVPLPDASEWIEGFHFEAYTDVLLKELSTGNRKKADLITAFALQPELLLLDEPVNGLDFQSTEFLYRQMGSYKEHGTILFSSHILESICLTSDQVLVLEQGKIRQTFTGEEIAAGTIREVLSFEKNAACLH
ncbi:ABC transporter ATP-binding protein [Cuneatibacter sp. NSJ-177]|uniref:ATP-binding cassette domain-containing protein n=1 Tax=Cuneatibacter sp. NSJ-177 TaxID=2931401 RepID=UPI001FD2A597|nr:ABC transporter ATP-binding protein [Cuneatibacter sp. NSJ-177]MCJ7834662.1 ABC transporter ATP-binding protein [Cuneatibacter sp. NSJ-177]